MLEAILDKRRIFEIYLNVIEWGTGVFGSEAAARHYFGTSAAQLDAEQAARLAAMTPNPRRLRTQSGIESSGAQDPDHHGGHAVGGVALTRIVGQRCAACRPTFRALTGPSAHLRAKSTAALCRRESDHSARQHLAEDARAAWLATGNKIKPSDVERICRAAGAAHRGYRKGAKRSAREARACIHVHKRARDSRTERGKAMLLNRSITDAVHESSSSLALLLVVGSFYLVLEQRLPQPAQGAGRDRGRQRRCIRQLGLAIRPRLGQGQRQELSRPGDADQRARTRSEHDVSRRRRAAALALSTRRIRRWRNASFRKSSKSRPRRRSFGVTSHNFMNPVNKPDAFEGKALDADPQQASRGILRDASGYATATRERCTSRRRALPCHASAGERAERTSRCATGPSAASAFARGEVAGIISVRLPTRSFWSVATGVIGPVQIALLLSRVPGRDPLYPVRASCGRCAGLTAAAGRISVGEQADLGVGRISRKSGNEIHQLILATERLRASLMLARFKRNRRPPPA